MPRNSLRARSLAKSVGDPNDRPTIAVTAVDGGGKSRATAHRSKTLTWLEIPEWQKDNEYILSGYRRATASWRACAASVFGYLHNETVNIHSHLGGAVLFVALLFTFPSVYFVHYESTTWADMTVFAIFLCSAIFCLFSSAFYHTFSVHSPAVAGGCNALDYAGIVVLTVGSFFPCVYYGFFCEPHYQAGYLTCICVVGVGAAYIVLNPEYRKPTHRGARTRVFILLGLCGVVPTLHGLVTHGFYTMFYEMGFGWLLLSAVLYITSSPTTLFYHRISALHDYALAPPRRPLRRLALHKWQSKPAFNSFNLALYHRVVPGRSANRIPERLSPGTFDYFFASHQIFHFCVVAAALAHYASVLTAFGHWHRRLAECPAS